MELHDKFEHDTGEKAVVDGSYSPKYVEWLEQRVRDLECHCQQHVEGQWRT